MSDTGHLQVTLQLCGDPDNSGHTPSGYVEVTINGPDINWEEALRELRQKLVDWAMTFMHYSETNEITIRPNSRR